jgi:hypothetical protein
LKLTCRRIGSMFTFIGDVSNWSLAAWLYANCDSQSTVIEWFRRS